MSIDVKGKDARLWIDERQGKDGNSWRQYRVGLSTKIDDEYVNSYMKVRFKRDIDVSNVQNGTKFDFEGFLTIDKPWIDKDGKERKDPMIVIMSADFGELGDSGFKEAEVDIPFQEGDINGGLDSNSSLITRALVVEI